MAQGLQEDANGVGERRKTTETDTRSSLSTLYACTRRFPPKFVLPRVPTNQIIELPARARFGCTRYWHASAGI